MLLSVNISAFRDVAIYISHLNQLKYSSNFAQNGNKEIPSQNPLVHRVHTDNSQVFPVLLEVSSKQLESSSSFKVPAQTGMVVCHSWHTFNKILALGSRIILCSHLLTCFCTDFWSNCWVQLMSAFRSFLSLSSFKMVVPTGHWKSINQHFELDYLIRG